MQEKPNVRIKSLSTRYLRFYKIAGYVLMIIVGIGVSYFYVTELSGHGKFAPILRFWNYLYVLWFVVLWWKLNSKVYHVEFDDEFLYVILRNNDILIPLENIKDVNIVTLGGVYRIDLYNAEQLGDKIYFKPSLLYPFNSKKKDELANVLWQKINQAKMKQPHFQKNALHS